VQPPHPSHRAARLELLNRDLLGLSPANQWRSFLRLAEDPAGGIYLWDTFFPWTRARSPRLLPRVPAGSRQPPRPLAVLAAGCRRSGGGSPMGRPGTRATERWTC
jgi:hypothetical protein